MIACSGSPSETPDDAVVAEPAQHGALDLSLLAEVAEVDRSMVAPTAEETRLAVEKAGLGSLGKRVPERNYRLDVPDKDRVALRTGVLLADTVLSVRDADPKKLAAMLRDVQTGMRTLEADPQVVDTLGELAGQLDNDSITRDDLLKTLDEATSDVRDEMGGHGRFVQAGAWLAGSNLVAGAVLESGDPSSATALLSQPDVAEYYLDYVRSDAGKEKAGADIAEALEDTLATLLELSGKSELTLEDVGVIQKKTQDILDLI